jgi:hypothetical protein
MAWQQRNSGHKYASPSGHALLVAAKSRKPIALVIKSKLCNYCSSFVKQNPDCEGEVPPHDCPKNHFGTSGAMEPQACLEMVTLVFDNHKCVVKYICINDDSLTRAKVKWSNADYMLNNNTTILPQVPISKGDRKGQLQDRPDKGGL